MWYELLGGKTGDPLFMNYMSRQNLDPKNPTPQVEEDLVIELLKNQSLGINNPPPPKRRSSFFKEALGKISSGNADQQKDGESEAKKLNTSTGKQKLAYEELAKGKYYSSLAAYKNFLDKGGSAKNINEIPFVIAMSGMSKTWPQDLANGFK